MTRNISVFERRLRQKMIRSLAGPVVRAVRSGVFFAETRMRRSLPIDRYCRGEGVEVGAAASPAIVPPGCKVRYVDKYNLATIAADPELAGLDPVVPDFVCSGDRLEAIDSGSQDFVLAFSLLEHVQDPIGALCSFARVTKPGGTIIVTVPDKRHYGPDRTRPLTSFEHFVRDHREGPEWSRENHFRESGELGKGLRGAELEAYVRDRMDSDGHTHFHVWDAESFLDFLLRTRTLIGLPVELLEFAQYGHEALGVLKVRATPVQRPTPDGLGAQGTSR